MTDQKAVWEGSYLNRDNFLFYPNEEVIRFVSKYIRKRIGLDSFRDIMTRSSRKIRSIDLGCGIGRHIIYCNEMGFDSYGIDLSEEAIKVARIWAGECGVLEPKNHIVQGSVQKLPWPNNYFDFAISHAAFDSMPFETAQDGIIDASRALAQDGLFYLDLISGNDSLHSQDYAGEEVVKTQHEQGTTQSYFNLEKIEKLVEGIFNIIEASLVKRESIKTGLITSRWHLVLKNIG